MADYGWRVVNPGTGLIQADSRYKNLALRSKHVAGFPGGSMPFRRVVVTVPTSVSGVLAWRCDQPAALVYKSGNDYTFWSPGAYAPGTLTIYAFDEPQYASLVSGPYGVRAKNTVGSVTFDSRLGYMKFQDLYQGTIVGAPNNESFSRSYPRLPAVVQGNLAYRHIWLAVGVSPPFQYIETLTMQFTSTPGASTVTWTIAQFANPPTLFPPSGHIDTGQDLRSQTIMDVAGL